MVTPSSGGGSVAWSAVGVYGGLVVVQVLMGFVGFNNAYAEMDPNANPINGTVMAVLFLSPTLIALVLVVWAIVAMVRANRRAKSPDSPAAGPDSVTPGAAPPTPASPPKGQTWTGVLIGAAAFLITCAGPCFAPSLSQLTTPTPTQTTSPAPLPEGSDLPAEPGPPGVTFTAVP